MSEQLIDASVPEGINDCTEVITPFVKSSSEFNKSRYQSTAQ